MTNANLTMLGALLLSACSTEGALRTIPGVDGDAARGQGDVEDAGSEVLSAAELELLASVGVTVPHEVGELGLGEVVVTLTDAGTEIEMEGMAIQLQSDDRFYDNTIVYAWSGLDADAGTVDHLLWFDVTYHSEDGTLTIDAVSLDADTEVDCTDTSFQFEDEATCTDGTVEGGLDMTALGYEGLGASYVGPSSRGVSTSTLALTVEYDVPVQRISFER